MKTYNITYTYEIELEARDKKQALEMAGNSLLNAIHCEKNNCFEAEIEEVLK